MPTFASPPPRPLRPRLADPARALRKNTPLLWGLAFLFALFAGELAAVLRANDGTLTYTLDDPYIHLALAENIARGHYGVNLDEYSAPSSSIAWAPLLAPFALTPLAPWAPLLLNLLCAAALAAVFAALLRRALGDAVPPWIHALLLCALLLASNVAGLAFMGMEHLLQVLAAALVALGLAIDAGQGRTPRWLPWAIVLAPLARYELVTVSAGALVYLALRGRPLLAALLGAAMAALLAAFSAWLLSLGLDFLPSSVLLKSGMPSGSEAGGGGSGALASLANLAASAAARLREASMHDRGTWLLLFLALLGARGLFPPRADSASAAPLPAGSRARALAAGGAAAAALHLLLGGYGSSNRYEVYILTFCLLLLAVLFGGPLARFLREGARERAGRLALVAVIVVFTGAYGYRYLSAAKQVPRFAHGIYLQQYQMHRFVTGWYKKPVAVNDLGWASFRNDGYVLDLWGLASPEALRLRRAAHHGSPEWMENLARARGVGLVMVYRFWFEDFPASWIEIGTLRDGRGHEAPGSRVTFFARGVEARDEAAARLRDFRKTLPAPAEFVFTEEESNGEPGPRRPAP